MGRGRRTCSKRCTTCARWSRPASAATCRWSALTALRAEAVRRVAPRAAAEFATLVGDPAQTLAAVYEPSIPGGEGAGEGVAERAERAERVDRVARAFRDRLAERRQDELV